jgi:hypothetical protein
MAAFDIDGREYPIPSVFQLTMGEAQTLFDYCGYTLEDFVPPLPGVEDDRVRMLRDPAFKRAMVHIAYQRGNPELNRDEVAALVDGVQMFDMVAAMYTDEDADPTPVSQKQQPPPSEPATRSSTKGSGRRSKNTSEQQDGIPAPTGTTE